MRKTNVEVVSVHVLLLIENVIQMYADIAGSGEIIFQKFSLIKLVIFFFVSSLNSNIFSLLNIAIISKRKLQVGYILLFLIKKNYSCGDGSLGTPSKKGDNYECRNMKLLLKQQQRVKP